MNTKLDVLIPLIRKVMPSLIARDIAGVQPMPDIFRSNEVELITTYTAEDDLPYCAIFRYSAYEFLETMILWAESTWDTRHFRIETGSDLMGMQVRCRFSSEVYRDLFILKWSR